MKIGILDDNTEDKERLKYRINAYFYEKPQMPDIVEFTHAEELFEYFDKVHNNAKIDILFLDIELPEMDGIEIKNKLVNSDNVFSIVFVTSHNEVMSDAFGFKVIDFVVKPVSQSAVDKILDIIINRVINNIIINITGENEMYLEDLEYIKGCGNYSYIYTKCKEKEDMIVKQIGVLEEELNKLPIIRIHKSYIVNLINVSNVLSKQVIMNNNDCLPLGRKYSENVKNEFIQFKKNQLKNRRF